MKKHRNLIGIIAAGAIIVAGALTYRQLVPLPPVRRTPSLKWRPATGPQRSAAASSITRQLIAFRKNDYKTAASYQSASLKRNFPSVQAFRDMMKKSYPQFANYKSVVFGPARADTTGKFVEIMVKLTGRDGVQVRAVYTMVLEAKVFRVAAVAGGDAPRPRRTAPPEAGLTV